MVSKRTIFFYSFLCIAISLIKINPSFGENKQIIVPLGGNSWIQNGKKIEALMDTNGITNWKSQNSIIHTYIYFERPGTLTLSLRLKVTQGKSKLKLSTLGSTLVFEDAKNEFHIIKVGKIAVKNKGYAKIDLQGISKTGTTFADITDIILEGTPVDIATVYVKNNEENYYYWGHRGPSVHLNYTVPESIKNDVEWFYNELTVPKGKDPIGSYFMANGFKEGYFGIQVNSEKE